MKKTLTNKNTGKKVNLKKVRKPANARRIAKR